MKRACEPVVESDEHLNRGRRSRSHSDARIAAEGRSSTKSTARLSRTNSTRATRWFEQPSVESRFLEAPHRNCSNGSLCRLWLVGSRNGQRLLVLRFADFRGDA